ncbi:MAG: SMP-30/gluconolactonase/LRE family protein [Planctomycetota bacterium]
MSSIGLHNLTLILFAWCLISNGHQTVAAFQDTDSPVDQQHELILKLDQFEMADGPMWDGGNLIVPDVRGGKVFRYNAREDKTTEFKNATGRFSASFFNHGRRFLSDNAGGRIAFLDGQQVKTVASFAQWNPQPKNGQPVKKGQLYRPNDLVVDNKGGIYVTFTPQNRVIYVAADGTQSVAVEGIKTPNGITMSPDGSTLYVSSFVPKEIYAYPIAAPGKTGAGKKFATMDDGPERGADGMTIDRAGNVYCAGKSDIWIWNPDGKLLDKIACPSKPINCTFMDQDMRTLAITAKEGVYVQRMKVSGVVAQKGVVELQPKAEHPLSTNPKLPSVDISSYDIGTKHLDVVYAQYGTRKLLLDLFVPANTQKAAPCVIVVHGGGWHNGDKKSFRAMALELCRRGFVTAAIEYRLADEAPFPAAMHDCSAAVRFLRANADKYSIDQDQIMAVGGSAGGHLVGLMASGARNPNLQGAGGNPGVSSEITAAVVLAGPLQIVSGKVAEQSLDPDAKSNARSWMRGTVEEKRGLYLMADAMEQIDNKTCPILFQVGEKDNPDRNQSSREKLKTLSVKTKLIVYPDAKHGCWNRKPWFTSMINDMEAFLKNK